MLSPATNWYPLPQDRGHKCSSKIKSLNSFFTRPPEFDWY